MRALVVVFLLVARTAAAQAPGETPPAPEGDKSLLSAYLISVAATSGPLVAGALLDSSHDDHSWRAPAAGALGIAGLVLGPSAGHWYAGEDVTTGLVLRGGAAAAVATLALSDPYLHHPVATIGGLIGAVGVWEVGIIWDAATLPRAIRRANRRVRIAPMITGNGVAIAGSF